MKNLYVDDFSHTVQISKLSIGLNISEAGVIKEIEPDQFVRVKSIEGNSVIKLENTVGDGVLLSEGETEYFFIDRHLELVSGSVNIMY